jgi:hypothetical protein
VNADLTHIDDIVCAELCRVPGATPPRPKVIESTPRYFPYMCCPPWATMGVGILRAIELYTHRTVLLATHGQGVQAAANASLVSLASLVNARGSYDAEPLVICYNMPSCSNFVIMNFPSQEITIFECK